MAYNHLNVPHCWQHYYSKYPQGMTIMESLLEWVAQVDGMVDTMNLTIEEVTNFKENILPANLQTILIEWEASGKLSEVLTEAILTGKANKADLDALQLVVDGLSDTMNDTLENLTASVTAKLSHLPTPATEYFTGEQLADLLSAAPVLDHTAAVQAYIDAQRAAGRYNLYFPRGQYRIKNVNLYENPWNIYGQPAADGYIHETTFIVIASAGAVGFNSTARNITFRDLGIVSSGSRNDGMGVGFYKNTLIAGQFITVKNVYITNFSGVVFSTLDLIDSTFEAVRSDDSNTVLKAHVAGWDRSTTVTLKKWYAIRGDKILDMPKVAQSRMVDCIFENNLLVGDISSGQWTIDNCYFENNTAGLDATNSTLVKKYSYFNTAADAILNPQTGLDQYHWGESEQYAGGAHFSRFSKHYEVAGNLAENNTGSQQWTHLGVWHTGGGGSRLQAEFLGAAGFSQAGGGSGLAGSTGKTTLFATFTGQSNPSLPALTAYAYHEGSAKPVLKIKLVATDQNYNAFNIFVLNDAYASKVGFKLELTAGYFRKDVQVGVADPGTANQNLVDVPFEYRIQTGTGAVKITDDGGIEMTKPVIAGGAAPATINNYTYIAINGTYYKIPLYL